MSKCRLGARHSWTWIKDRQVKTARVSLQGASVKISMKGVYQCKCGDLKWGEPRGGFTASAV